ncbi:MAG: alpha/beta hydrolase [Syntrophaceae bacterium]|nr:alpha/beta hydrolase [Syntrophaceae bacterium]
MLPNTRTPLPACAVCISAWTDLTLKGKDYEERKKGDHLFKSNVLHDCAYNYLQGKDPSDPSISPVFGNFSNLPPILFHVGSEEILLNDSVTAANKAKAAGTQAELQIWPNMVHDFQLWAKVLPDARKAIYKMGDFVKRNIP